MKTILKSGQRIEIYCDDFSSGCQSRQLEGLATLFKLIRKSHTNVPPTETWLVRFDDDNVLVERDIEVKLPYVPGMLSSLARSPEGRNLLLFMASAGLSDDWADPTSHGVTAYVNGKILDNAIGAVELVNGRQVNEEILVHLECANSKVILNLNTLIALASRYIRQQYDVAAEAVQNSRPEVS